MNPKTKFFVEDIKLFLKYMLKFEDVVAVLESSAKLIFSKQFWLWIITISFIYIMLKTASVSNRAFIGAFLLILWFIVASVPIYKSGQHRAWARERYKHLNKNKREEQEDEQRNVKSDERLPDGSDSDV